MTKTGIIKRDNPEIIKRLTISGPIGPFYADEGTRDIWPEL